MGKQLAKTSIGGLDLSRFGSGYLRAIPCAGYRPVTCTIRTAEANIALMTTQSFCAGTGCNHR